MRVSIILMMMVMPAAAEVAPGSVLCRPGTTQCRRVDRPEPAHRSVIPNRVYAPFEREPREVRPARPFER